MSDAERRRSLREWLLGDPAAGLRDLIGRQRAGSVDHPQLLLLAYLGYGPAESLVGDSALFRDPRIFHWVRGLASPPLRQAPELCIQVAARAAIASLTHALPSFPAARQRLSAELLSWARKPAGQRPQAPDVSGYDAELMLVAAIHAQSPQAAIDRACVSIECAARVADHERPDYYDELRKMIEQELLAWLLS